MNNENMPEMKMDSVGSLWRTAWKTYADRFDVLTKIIVVPVLFLALGNILMAIGGLPIALAGSLFLAAGVLLSIVAAAAIIYSLHHTTGFDESYRAGGRLFWRLIWISILAGFAILGGFFIFIIPGAWLWVGFVFSSYIMVIEGKSGFEALTESREYVRGYWWAVFGRVLLVAIVYIVAGIIIGIPFSLIGGGAIGRAISSMIITLFFIPFATAYSYTMYRNLAALKPGVHTGAARKGKTFIVVIQVIGVIAALIIAVGICATLFGPWARQGWIPCGVACENGSYGGDFPPSLPPLSPPGTMPH